MRQFVCCAVVLFMVSTKIASAYKQPSCGCWNDDKNAAVHLTEAQMRSHVEHIEMEPDRMGNDSNGTGIAVFKIIFGEDGRVVCAKVISGHPLAVTLLMAAVGKWRFTPYVRNGIA